MQSSISSQKTPKYKKLSRKRKTAQNLSILSCFMMECRWWDSNPHGFPNDFESFASAIPPHRLIFNFGTLVPVSEDWRDVQEGCKKSCFNKLSKFNEYSWISCTDTKNHEADFEFSAFLSGCIVTDRTKKLIRILSWQFHFNPPIKEIFRPEIIAKDAAMVITPMPPILLYTPLCALNYKSKGVKKVKENAYLY